MFACYFRVRVTGIETSSPNNKSRKNSKHTIQNFLRRRLATDKGSVFGEFTPTPALGKGFTKAGDKLLARYLAKYCKGMI